ncbi:glycoside-pentoside-hexuronide (GPH):cation symporter [Paenibacillus macquariensis]|uniref:Glycoside/pentoside/hexuronide:cation symporter, GPH family n=1 Tax=Paenibacillus macquariensis TaxID=948756 RepID=A0ABY1K5Y4_9BACL|nr:MFS transporter [Paenibacillus macquariensis]MEC0090553.1 MFS transporter [Paenibacillus macquariensis]OAB38549.1 sodium:solute symporter [Paenibacillus macquariensis subsp. macquariensis]SIR31051.1 glycoside/pentoside/hexuronide:cation symporter, GPH family [Paenibacillus macquariensis]
MKNQVPWKERISYGLGDTASNLIFQTVTMYLMFYYTDVFGLNIAAVGTLFLVARIIDAFDGPIFGVLIDRTTSKWGKSRPWFLWLSFPFAIIAILAFLSPDFGDTGKLAYAYLTYILLNVLYAGINVPLSSILPSLSSDSQERTVVASIRMILAQVGALFVSIATLPLVEALGNGDQKKGFMLTMMIYAVVALVLFLITFKNVRERVQVNGNRPVPFKEGIKAIKGNTPWWILLATGLFVFIGVTAKGPATIYFFKYNLGREDLIPLVNGLGIIMLLAIVFVPFLSKKLGKRNTMLTGMVIGMVGQLITYLGAQMMSIPTVLTGVIIGNFGGGIAFGLMFAMIADTIDYGEWKSGVRAPGLLSAASTVGAKFGMGLGGAIAAWVLSIGNYVPNQKQGPSALLAIEFNFIWLTLISNAIVLVLLMFYKLDRVEHQMNNDLTTRRGGSEIHM